MQACDGRGKRTLFTGLTTAYGVNVGSLLGTLRNPKVAALVFGGLVALAISVAVPTTPETVTVVNGVQNRSSEMHPIDAGLTFCRFLGALSLLIGSCAMFAYRRGEMDVPDEAHPPLPEPRDHGLPPTPPAGISAGNYLP